MADNRRVLLPQDSFWEPQYRWFCRKTGDLDLAADLLQDTKLRFHLRRQRRGIDAYSDECLVHLCRNDVWAHWCQRGSSRPEMAADDIVNKVVDDAPLPDDMAARREHNATRWAKLENARLSERERFVIQHWTLSNIEVAKRLNTTRTVIATCRYKIKKRLR